MPSKRISESQASTESNRRHAVMTLGALGVVYGDIGTSPLYAFRECFHGSQAIELNPENILGVLSLIFWSLIVVVSIKYLIVVLRADNDGDGGILALMVLALHKSMPPRKKWILTALGLFGAGLLYGDGMITPAISVLSAVEGLNVTTGAFRPYIIPISVGILLSLFVVQRRGTAAIAGVFGPIMFLWFTCLILMGIPAILNAPQVLTAVSPHHAAMFFVRNQAHALVILGVVFLVVTGGEALYADMGHFSARPIRSAWFALVLPALLVNYFGQGALLWNHPSLSQNPFYLLAPSWALYPLVALATLATVIASQAVISGAFSLASQAVRLGFTPRLEIAHTSNDDRGQVYVPAVNWALFVAVVGLVLAFRESSNLAAAYGMAVSTTMLMTTVLLYVVARERWNWTRPVALLLMGFFLLIDVLFFSANLIKIAAGGWIPLLAGAVAWCLMTTWIRGRQILAQRVKAKIVSLETLLDEIERLSPYRVPGSAVFLTAHPSGAPLALVQNLRHNKVLHETVAILQIATEDRPRVRPEHRVDVQSIGMGLFRVTGHYGFKERPNVARLLAQCRHQGLDVDYHETTFVLGRETLEIGRKRTMALWRKKLFAWLSRNARDASAHFGIPPNQVMEIGVQFEI